MNDKTSKTTICSIVFLDIIDYSKKSVSEQIDIKNQFNHLINHSLKDVEQDDRIILDTGDGAAIAHMGSPEDALFVSLSIRDEILKSNIMTSMPLYVRFGINLGPVRVVRDINGQPNMIGDGINVAQRIMSFAKPNQILVSRSDYDVTSRLTQEISQMFDYSGLKHDKHVREHEVYAVRLLKETITTETNTAQIDRPTAPTFNPFNWFNRINWKYLALALPAIMTLVVVIKTAATPREPMITLQQTLVEKPLGSTATKVIESILPDSLQLLPNETIETNSGFDAQPAQASVKQKPAKKTAKKADVKLIDNLPPDYVPAQSETQQQSKLATNSDELTNKSPTPTAAPAKNNFSWKSLKDSIQKGGEGVCSQAEISMNQCH